MKLNNHDNIVVINLNKYFTDKVYICTINAKDLGKL